MNEIYFLDQEELELRARENGLRLYFSLVEGLSGEALEEAVRQELHPKVELWN